MLERNTAMVNITVVVCNKIFACPVGWTVKEAEEEIRSRHGLINGGIYKNGMSTRPADQIEEVVAYEFVYGEKIQSAPPAQGE